METTNVTTTETTKATLPAAKRRYWWKAIASFLMVLFTMPFGARADDYHGTLDERDCFALFGLCHGRGRSGDGDCRRIRQRGYTPNTLGILRRSALLDRLGGISLHVFCQPFRHAGAARSGNRRDSQPAGIPDTSVHIRVLGHDDDAVPVLHCQWLQFPELVAALVLRQAQEGNRRTPHDTPYQHCRFYGSHYHAVDVLLGADVLLR